MTIKLMLTGTEKEMKRFSKMGNVKLFKKDTDSDKYIIAISVDETFVENKNIKTINGFIKHMETLQKGITSEVKKQLDMFLELTPTIVHKFLGYKNTNKNPEFVSSKAISISNTVIECINQNDMEGIIEVLEGIDNTNKLLNILAAIKKESEEILNVFKDLSPYLAYKYLGKIPKAKRDYISPEAYNLSELIYGAVEEENIEFIILELGGIEKMNKLINIIKKAK